MLFFYNLPRTSYTLARASPGGRDLSMSSRVVCSQVPGTRRLALGLERQGESPGGGGAWGGGGAAWWKGWATAWKGPHPSRRLTSRGVGCHQLCGPHTGSTARPTSPLPPRSRSTNAGCPGSFKTAIVTLGEPAGPGSSGLGTNGARGELCARLRPSLRLDLLCRKRGGTEAVEGLNEDERAFTEHRLCPVRVRSLACTREVGAFHSPIARVGK